MVLGLFANFSCEIKLRRHLLVSQIPIASMSVSAVKCWRLWVNGRGVFIFGGADTCCSGSVAMILSTPRRKQSNPFRRSSPGIPGTYRRDRKRLATRAQEHPAAGSVQLSSQQIQTEINVLLWGS